METSGPEVDDYCLGHAASDDPILGATFERLAVANRAHLEQVGIESFSRCLVLVRGSSSQSWVRTLRANQLLRVCRRPVLDSLWRAVEIVAGEAEVILRTPLRLPPGTALTLPGEEEARMLPGPISFADEIELDDDARELFGLFHDGETVERVALRLAEQHELPVARVRDDLVRWAQRALLTGALVLGDER